MENNNPKIHFPKGTAYKIKNGQRVNVEEIDATACDCRIDACDCGLIMTDLQTEAIYFLAVINGKLTISTEASYIEFKESGDYTDLSATVVGAQIA